ncbi:hypothetical protein PInf_001169 [Phytophthora infestans]|nr:hypothetical protein PInf_001169 [Phytophthora infestans]
MEHMKVHRGWLFLRGKFRWKKRWGVVVACNKQRTSKELCVFHSPDDVRPDAVLLVDESARASPFTSSDSFCWLKREYAFIFDKPVMCQRVKRQKLTRSPICRKTISQEDVQTRDLVFAADNFHNLERWQRVLQSNNFYDRETGAPLYGMPPYDVPRGELYYWPHELVENVRSSTLRQQERREENRESLAERLRRTLEQPQPQDEEPIENMLRGLQEPNTADGNNQARVRFATSELHKTVEVVQPAQHPPPSEGEGNNEQESSVGANDEQQISSSLETEEPDFTTRTQISELLSTDADGVPLLQPNYDKTTGLAATYQPPNIKLIEEKLEKISQFSLELMNERDELALMIAHVKEQTIRLAAAAGVPTHKTGYVMSFSVALEQCCEALLEHI